MSNPSAPVLNAQSNLTYTPPPETPIEEHQEFADTLKDAISSIGAEFEAERDPAPLDVGDDVPEAEAPEEPQEQPEGEPEEPEDAEDDVAVKRGLDRLVAREVALQQKEAAFQAQQSQYQAVVAELQALKASAPPQDVVQLFDVSPSEALKSLGHDPETVVQLLIAEQLRARGKEVPPELQKATEKAAYDKRIRSLESKLAQTQKAQEAAAYINAVGLGAHEYVKGLTDPKTQAKVGKVMPTLAGIAKTSPDRVHREIMEEITRDAQSRAAAEPNGQPLTYEEAAKRVESRLSDYKSLFAPLQNDGTTKQVVGAKGTPPQQKPPTKPLTTKPWEKKGDDLIKSGIDEAIREFQKHELANRRR